MPVGSAGKVGTGAHSRPVRLCGAADAGSNGASGVPDAPRWDLAPIYDGFDGNAYRSDVRKLRDSVSAFAEAAADGEGARAETAAWVARCIELINRIEDLYENLDVYCYISYSVDTTNTVPLREMNALKEVMLAYYSSRVDFRNNVAAAAVDPERLGEAKPELSEYVFFITEELEEQRNQMTAPEENLAADLARSGADAWGRLQETVSANLAALWDTESGARKTVVQLRGMAFDPDRSVRQRAYRAELDAWKSMEIPLAAALNGVKGAAVTLDGRRRYESSLERARRTARISRDTLDALIGVMEESLPDFRRYLKAKAKLLGQPSLAFYDLFAPIGAADRDSGDGRWTFGRAREFIVTQFRTFSDELADFADRAFEERWIDAEPREGKVGGAYCASSPLRGQSRILANFDGSFSSVSTLAHELGHGYHHEVLKDACAIHRGYPMTLAETASIFCETIVFTGAYDGAAEGEKIGILEAFLQDATQVIVDILSRFKFESAVFERRPAGELSADDFKELMIEAQRATYGDGLDAEQLHPYMWAVKGHYYNQNLSFYNFPYAFGQLFGLGLFAQYRQMGPDFPPQYRRILELTGRASAETVTGRAGFNIRQRAFWRSGIDYVRSRIDEFVERVDAAVG
ncbi:MAG: M3 family oligoendopeptidase [bacterium]